MLDSHNEEPKPNRRHERHTKSSKPTTIGTHEVKQHTDANIHGKCHGTPDEYTHVEQHTDANIHGKCHGTPDEYTHEEELATGTPDE